MRRATQSIQAIGLVTAIAVCLALLGAPSAGAAKGSEADEQLAFGVQMAKRGLWNEAAFRFSRVLKQRPGDVRVLNNLAVAYEAIGEFELALEHYKRALEGDSGNKELRRNYAQFVEFYESLRPETTDPEAEEASQTEGEVDSDSVESVEDSVGDSVEEGEAKDDGESADEPDRSS